MSRKNAFTLIEIMIVVAIIGLLAMIAIPAYTRARNASCRSSCINNLRIIESAKDGYTLDYGGTNGMPLTWNNLSLYMKDLTNKCFCPSAQSELRGRTNYTINPEGAPPDCTVAGAEAGHTLEFGLVAP